MAMVGSPSPMVGAPMDKLYRLIRSSDSCCDYYATINSKDQATLLNEKRRAHLFLSGLSGFAHQKSVSFTKNYYDRFQKGWILFLNVGLISAYQASLTVIECFWHFSFSCAGILSALFWMILPILAR